MDAERAAEQLLTIRQLMERAALYRRALAPAMLGAGALGVLVAAGGVFASQASGPLAELADPKGYFAAWIAAACAAALGALLITRAQSWRAGEAFWTPPARRVAESAFVPWLACFTLLAPLATTIPQTLEGGCRLVAASVPLWTIGHGFALYSAGFHTLRGVRLMGLGFVAAGVMLAFYAARQTGPHAVLWAHTAMGATFGLGHLAAGLFLWWTESRSAR